MLDTHLVHGTLEEGKGIFHSKGVNSFYRRVKIPFCSVQYSRSSRPILCDPMNCSRAGFPVHHKLLGLAQTDAHQVGDDIQPSHPLSSPSLLPLVFPIMGSFPVNHFFASSGQSIEAWASILVLPMKIQDWFPSELTGWDSLQSKGLSRVFSNSTVLKYQFFGAQISL